MPDIVGDQMFGLARQYLPEHIETIDFNFYCGNLLVGFVLDTQQVDGAGVSSGHTAINCSRASLRCRRSILRCSSCVNKKSECHYELHSVSFERNVSETSVDLGTVLLSVSVITPFGSSLRGWVQIPRWRTGFAGSDARKTPQVAGDFTAGEIPVPIPNTEVKPRRADCTARESVWESRSSPT